MASDNIDARCGQVHEGSGHGHAAEDVGSYQSHRQPWRACDCSATERARRLCVYSAGEVLTAKMISWLTESKVTVCLSACWILEDLETGCIEHAKKTS